MALSKDAKLRLVHAMTSQAAADEMESSATRESAAVADMGATAALVGVDGTGSNAAPLAGTEARLDAIEAKMDELLAAMRAAGLMKA